jgi:hypothetical protein
MSSAQKSSGKETQSARPENGTNKARYFLIDFVPEPAQNFHCGSKSSVRDKQRSSHFSPQVLIIF